MPIAPAASDVFDREFLGVRARLIDIAATLDRIDRAGGLPDDNPRLDQIRRSARLLATDAPDRAAQIQMLFSLPYRDDWQKAR
ncbi:MAG: hypothetical protein HQ567_20755 [Candidatus Nealsonbacteria bacterium]|nr:hypothetical protein [Candidatus Nealsonbacteria bacterium]